MDKNFNIWPYILIFAFGVMTPAISKVGRTKEEVRVIDLSSSMTVEDIEKIGFQLDKSMGIYYKRGSVTVHVEDDQITSVHFRRR